MSSSFSTQRTRMPGERLFCFLLVAFSVFLFWQAYKINGFTSLSSAGAFPLASSGAMILASCVVFMHTLKLPATEGVRFFHHCVPPVVAIIMAIILVYAVTMDSIGFTLTTFAFLFICIQFLYRRSVLFTFAISLISLIIIYIIFRLVFQVVLPEGIVPERAIIAAIKTMWGK